MGDGPASEFYLDGKSMMAFAPAENLAAVAEAPPTIDAALKKAYETAAIYFPFTDLLLADPYAALAEGTKLAFYIGPSGIVGGVKTDMVAWANDDVFMQMWVGVDDKLPRRIRAVFVPTRCACVTTWSCRTGNSTRSLRPTPSSRRRPRRPRRWLLPIRSSRRRRASSR